MTAYEMVVGLEVHVELATRTKLFCACSAAFGGAPNTHCCPVCSGMPGALPVLNRRVVDLAIATGLALGCRITRHTQFDRKNYFYPDLPKAYQISQLYMPICRGGGVQIDVGGVQKTVRIHEIHMEEDAGKLVHDPWTDRTMADYNRCGVPLLEIVSEPDMRSPEEVVAYLEKLRATLQYLGVSDCKMQEGSLRADVNLSVRPVGSEALGTRTEMKNLNSFKAIARAVAGEFRRQVELLQDGRAVRQETRRWDDNKDTSFAMRSKEDAQDYRYFPEPDLPPLVIDEAWIERVRASLPELAEAKIARFQRDMSLSERDARALTAEKPLCDLFEQTAARCGRPKDAANWVMGEVRAALKARGLAPDALTLAPEALARIVLLTAQGSLARDGAREALQAAMDASPDAPLDVDAFVRTHGLLLARDDGACERAVREALQAFPAEVARCRAGEEKLVGFLVGQAMKRMPGRGDPRRVSELLREALRAPDA